MSYQCKLCPAAHLGNFDAALRDGWSITIDGAVAVCGSCKKGMAQPQGRVVEVPREVLEDGNLHGVMMAAMSRRASK